MYPTNAIWKIAAIKLSSLQFMNIYALMYMCDYLSNGDSYI